MGQATNTAILDSLRWGDKTMIFGGSTPLLPTSRAGMATVETRMLRCAVHMVAADLRTAPGGVPKLWLILKL